MCISNQQAVRFIIWLKRVYHRHHLSHFLLLLSYIAFLLISATAFFLVESLQAKAYRSRYMTKMAYDRRVFVRDQLLPHIFNNSRLLVYIHDSKSAHLMSIVNERLQTYEDQLKLRPPMPPLPCTFSSALTFVFASVSTIGGHAYPMTNAGRILSMALSIFGIPFTMIVIKDLAFLVAKLFHLPCKWLEACWAAFRFCTLRSEGEDSLEARLRNTFKDESRDYREQHSDRLLVIPVAVAIFALIGWATLGCIIVKWHAPFIAKDANIAFYHVFNALTTTGLQELDAPSTGHLGSLLILLLYILIGLAIVSLFINLLHSKFSAAYWLPGRLHFPLPPHRHFEEEVFLASQEGSQCGMEQVGDYAMNHYTTLGVLQTDDKCPLICIARRDMAYADAITQTNKESGYDSTIGLSKHPLSPDVILLPSLKTASRDDVRSLSRETYTVRQPRHVIPQDSINVTKSRILQSLDIKGAAMV